MTEHVTQKGDAPRPDDWLCRARSLAWVCGRIRLSACAQRLIGKALFDPDRRVIMDWSGKAGCTVATKMFLSHMGLLEEAEIHHPWIHRFRKEVFYGRYPVTARDLLSRRNVLFKVVRNPFTRVVSSLRNKVRVPGKNRKIFEATGLDSIGEITFRRFVEFLESTDLRQRCDVHYRQQVREYEELRLRRPVVCRIERLEEDIARLNLRYGFAFDPRGISSDHHAKVDLDWNGFAADTPWKEFAAGLPPYRRFYDRELRDRVARIYRIDLETYGYTFPWGEDL